MITLTPAPLFEEVLDTAGEALARGDVHRGMDALRVSLREVWRHVAGTEWCLLGQQARRHPLHALLLESPFTRRAYEKPRGYAGDAVLMDLIYGLVSPARSLSPLGGMLYGYEFDSPCFQSVRKRRALLAAEIDRVAAGSGERVLAVASGHLREVEWSRAAHARAVTITALDQDRDCLRAIDRDYADYRVATVPASVGDLLRRAFDPSPFDLVYAAGLYDYLPDDLARSLTATLFRLLSPGGRLLIANFTPATHDAPFMETFMDWRLLYRTPQQLRELAASIPPADIAGVDQFCDDNQHVAYMRVVKR